MKTLASSVRRALRAKAHHLHPVVLVGQHGLTPAVLHEIDLALLAHELIKVRVFDDQRAARDALLQQICIGLDCAAVQHLGKILILWRANPALADAAPKKRVPEKKSGNAHAVKWHGPRPPADPVRERRRATKSSTTTGGVVRRGADRGKPAAEVVRPSTASPRDARRRTTTPTGARRPGDDARAYSPRPRAGAKPPSTTRSRAPRVDGGKPKPISKRRPAGEFDRSPPRDRHAGKPPRPMTTAGPRGYGDKTKSDARRVPAGKSSSGSVRKSPVGRRPPRDPLSSAPVPTRRRRKG